MHSDIAIIEGKDCTDPRGVQRHGSGSAEPEHDSMQRTDPRGVLYFQERWQATVFYNWAHDWSRAAGFRLETLFDAWQHQFKQQQEARDLCNINWYLVTGTTDGQPVPLRDLVIFCESALIDMHFLKQYMLSQMFATWFLTDPDLAHVLRHRPHNDIKGTVLRAWKQATRVADRPSDLLPFKVGQTGKASPQKPNSPAATAAEKRVGIGTPLATFMRNKFTWQRSLSKKAILAIPDTAPDWMCAGTDCIAEAVGLDPGTSFTVSFDAKQLIRHYKIREEKPFWAANRFQHGTPLPFLQHIINTDELLFGPSEPEAALVWCFQGRNDKAWGYSPFTRLGNLFFSVVIEGLVEVFTPSDRPQQARCTGAKPVGVLIKCCSRAGLTDGDWYFPEVVTDPLLAHLPAPDAD